MSRNLHRILQAFCLIAASFLATLIAGQLFVLPPTSALPLGIFAFLSVLGIWLLWRPGGNRRLPIHEIIALVAIAVFAALISLWVRSDPNLAEDWSPKYFSIYIGLVVVALIGLYHLTATPKRLSRFFFTMSSVLIFYVLLEALAGIALPMIVARSAGTTVRILETDYINPGASAPWRQEIGWASPLNATIRYRLSGFYDVTFVTNERGYRGPVVPYEKPPDTFRILVIGDSFVEALQVDYEKTFHALLKQQASNLQGKKVEVIGAGTSGYGTIHDYMYYKLEGYKYHPDLVVYLFSTNDPEDNYAEAYRPRMTRVFQIIPGETIISKPATVEDDTGLMRFVRSKIDVPPLVKRHSNIYKLRGLLFGGDLIRVAGSGALDKEPEMYTLDPPATFDTAWQRTRETLTIWVKDARANGSDFLMTTVPVLPIAKYKATYGARFQDLSNLVQSLGGYAVDPGPYCERYLQQHNLTPDDMFAAPGYDLHFSALAHQLLADSLQQWLLEHYGNTLKEKSDLS